MVQMVYRKKSVFVISRDYELDLLRSETSPVGESYSSLDSPGRVRSAGRTRPRILRETIYHARRMAGDGLPRFGRISHEPRLLDCLNVFDETFFLEFYFRISFSEFLFQNFFL